MLSALTLTAATHPCRRAARLKAKWQETGNAAIAQYRRLWPRTLSAGSYLSCPHRSPSCLPAAAPDVAASPKRRLRASARSEYGTSCAAACVRNQRYRPQETVVVTSTRQCAQKQKQTRAQGCSLEQRDPAVDARRLQLALYRWNNLQMPKLWQGSSRDNCLLILAAPPHPSHAHEVGQQMKQAGNTP